MRPNCFGLILCLTICVLALSQNSGALAANASLPDCEKLSGVAGSQFNFNESYPSYYQRVRRDQCRKDWTVLVFMEADNDLFPYASWNLWEMEAGTTDDVTRTASTSVTDLIVQAEGPQALASGQTSNSLRRLHMFSQKETGPDSPWSFATPKTIADFRSTTLDNVKSPVVEKLANSAHQSESVRLRDFLLWGQKKYPAKHYMIVVWGHGQGWGASTGNNKAGLLTSGGLAYRDSTGSWLSIDDFAKALNDFKTVNRAPADLVIADACLMQMMEVAYQLSPVARYILGTTHVQANQGLPYRKIMIQMNTKSFWGGTSTYRDTETAKDEPKLIALMIPHMWLNSVARRVTYNPDGSQHVYQGYHYTNADGYRNVTASSISSYALDNSLMPTLRALEGYIEDYLKEFPANDPHALWRVAQLKQLLSKVPLIEGGAQDFGSFLGMFFTLLRKEKLKDGQLSVGATMLVQNVTAATSELDHAVTAFVYGDGYGFDPTSSQSEFNRAVSIWLPRNSKEYNQRKSEFGVSKFYQFTEWNKWLDLVFQDG